MCPFYQTWKSMLERCYSAKYQAKKPTYKGCTVCDEWLTFSNFKAWMETQTWEGNHLDKDLLVVGNKVYSPETCLFVSVQVNSFLNWKSRNGLPNGVTWRDSHGKFRVTCSTLGKGVKHLGHFTTAEEAFKVWLDYKLSLAKELADLQYDQDVAEAIRKLTFED